MGPFGPLIAEDSVSSFMNRYLARGGVDFGRQGK